MKSTYRSVKKITFFDRLSRLNYIQACKLLGHGGSKAMVEGGKLEIDPSDVRLTDKRFTIFLLSPMPYEFWIEEDHGSKLGLKWGSSQGRKAVTQAGAAFTYLLDQKTHLGLAKSPDDKIPMELLSEDQLETRMLAERRERALKEKMIVTSKNDQKVWTDYDVFSQESGKTYRVAFRGFDPGVSYCACPDFRKNTLGTCKHLIRVENFVKDTFDKKVLSKPYQRKHYTLHLVYGKETELSLSFPSRQDSTLKVRPFRQSNPNAEEVRALLGTIRKLENSGERVVIYPDAEEYVEKILRKERLQQLSAEIRQNPTKHPLREKLLKTTLLPYQMDGIAFAVGAGRSILADEMGLGKTIQGIGVAELLAQEMGIQKVLVICPTSLKSQWESEIRRFCDRESQLITGSLMDRHGQYAKPVFYTICNYEQVLRDLVAIEPVKWDLIILDEGQRIKNWEAKTSATIKKLKSKYALVLSGTPLENRLDDLYSVVEFIDERLLGPAFRFFHKHRVANEKGKITGYKELDHLRKQLRPILLRRTRDLVLKEMPPRVTHIVRIPPTEEQEGQHAGHMRKVSAIIKKRFLTEMDIIQLQKELLMCRMTADSTALVIKDAPGSSTKLEKLAQLFDRFVDEAGRKIILFSEWTSMLDLIEPLLKERKLPFVRLDGNVAQIKRKILVKEFQENPQCRLFLTTNAGSTGLNLQAANTVVNVDLPWNPAVLEQRIARAHRMGQKNTVEVFILVTERTIEENLLATLGAKKELSMAALDFDSQVKEVTLSSGMEELKRRLEVLIGQKPTPTLETVTTSSVVDKEEVQKAGGEMLASVFKFISKVIPQREGMNSATEEAVLKGFRNCLETDAEGRHRFTVVLPDDQSLQDLAKAVGGMIGKS